MIGELLQANLPNRTPDLRGETGNIRLSPLNGDAVELSEVARLPVGPLRDAAVVYRDSWEQTVWLVATSDLPDVDWHPAKHLLKRRLDQDRLLMEIDWQTYPGAARIKVVGNDPSAIENGVAEIERLQVCGPGPRFTLLFDTPKAIPRLKIWPTRISHQRTEVFIDSRPAHEWVT